MKIGVNCGHTYSGAGCGTQGLFNESKWTRIIGYIVMSELIRNGHEVIDCTVHKANKQEDYLQSCVNIANTNKVDCFISFHFNSALNNLSNGVEVFNYGGVSDLMCKNLTNGLSQYGFRNRGTKNGAGLYVIKNTAMPAYLLEICFCNNEKDTTILRNAGSYSIAKTIADSILNSL